MSNTFKWTLVAVIGVLGMSSAVDIKGHQAANTLAQSIFKFDAEYGFVVPIPQKNVRFMGLPLFMALSSNNGPQGGPATDDLNRATKALATLSQCIATAETRLAEYNKPDKITTADIQNPHVWIDPEDEDKSRWTIVVEAKDNDGYAWHIEFKGADFHDIWAGS